MAQTVIRVSVLEGPYTHLQAVGVPLPLCMHMQELKLMLNEAQWTAKQSSGGFSVGFFWPASTATAGKLPYHSVVLKRNKRSRRKKKSNNGPGSKPRESPNAEEGSTLDLAAHSSSAVPANTPPPPPAPPSDAHPVDPVVSDLSSTENDSSGSDSFGLKSCESVALDIRDVPGVSFVKDGEPGWTPVVSLSKRKREKRKERKKLLSLPGSTSSSSDSDLNLSPILNTLWLMDLQAFLHKIKLVLSGGLLLLQGLAINSKVLQKNQQKHHQYLSVCFNILCMHVFLLSFVFVQ